MEIIDIKDLTKGYQEQVGEAYYEMAEEAAQRVRDACNKLVAEGLRGDKLQQLVNTHVKNVADAICAADGEVDKETGEPLEEAAELTRLYLLDVLERFCETKPPKGGCWIVTGEDEARCMAYVADED